MLFINKNLVFVKPDIPLAKGDARQESDIKVPGWPEVGYDLNIDPGIKETHFRIERVYLEIGLGGCSFEIHSINTDTESEMQQLIIIPGFVFRFLFLAIADGGNQ